MTNSHRNELSLKFAGKNFKIRCTLELLEEYEELFAEKKPAASVYYRIIGFLLSRSDKQIDEAAGAELAFSEGLHATEAAWKDFLETAYRTGDKAPDETPGKPQATE